MTNETKVGIVVVLCIIGVLALSAMLGNVQLFGNKGLTMVFHISDAAGLVPKAQVKYMGIKVGKVKAIKLLSDSVAITVVLESEHQIPDNVHVLLSQDGLMGEKFISLSLDDNEKPSITYLADGGVYYNYKPPVTLEDLSEKVVLVADDIRILVGALNETFATEEAKNDMKGILKNLKETTDNLNSIVKTNQNGINEIVENLRRSSVSIDNITASNQQDIKEIIDNLNIFTEELAKLMVTQEDNVSGTLANLKDLTDDAKITVSHLNSITKGADEGRGTIGMLLTDNDTRDSLKRTIDTLGSTIDRMNEVIFQVESGGDYFARHDKYNGRFNLKIIPSDKRYYMLGVSNKPFGSMSSYYTDHTIVDHTNGTTTKYTEYKDKYQESQLVFSLQYALMFHDRYVVRGGILDNTLGFGFDYTPLGKDKLTFTLEASDFYREKHGANLTGRVRYNFMDNFYAQAGWYDFTSSKYNSFTLGLGIYFVDSDLKYVVSSLPVSSVSQ